MGRHSKNDGENAPGSKYVGLEYDKTGAGKHRPKPDLTSGHAGSRHDGDGKSSPSGWGGDRSARK